MAKAIKRLYRSKQRMVAGVCGGIAEYFNVDPTIVRVLYVLATVLTGFIPLAVLYLIMWIIVPER